MAIRLNMKREPYWLDLDYGVRVFVEPVTTPVMMDAQEDMRDEDLSALGLDEKGNPATDVDFEDPEAQRLALKMAKAVARRVVLDWEGVGDDDGRPLEVTPEGIDALIDLWPIFVAFQERLLQPALLVEQEKNASAPLPTGTSPGARNTARPARRAAKSARTGGNGRKASKAGKSGS